MEVRDNMIDAITNRSVQSIICNIIEEFTL